MVEKILDLIGVKYRETRFIKPPQDTYAIYHDSYLTKGSDEKNLIIEHDYTIELYSYIADEAIEKLIEYQLNHFGIEFTKQERYWIEEQQLYQVIYEFNYIEKLKEE